ncbi:MAG: prenyltransferase [Chloroflexi bacterium]|nr:prenyltransferase [Chloroflexota bacterium]
MSRPLQLVAVTLVYLMGTTIALARGHALDAPLLAWGYVGVIFVSASIHYANEYADHETDALTSRTPFSGGSGALPRSGFSPLIAFWAAWVALTMGLGVAIAALVLSSYPWPAFGVLLFGAFFGWMYSLPPLALAWRGWGELDNAMLGGIALPLYGFTVQAGWVDPAVIAICLPFGALVFVNLLATTWPDREADSQVGKFTLATRWPASKLRRLYWLGAGVAFLSLAALAGSVLPPLVASGGFVVLPITLWGAVTYTRWHSPFPTVAAMILMLMIYLLAWGRLAWLG